jgi:hypothetical protein
MMDGREGMRATCGSASAIDKNFHVPLEIHKNSHFANLGGIIN